MQPLAQCTPHYALHKVADIDRFVLQLQEDDEDGGVWDAAATDEEEGEEEGGEEEGGEAEEGGEEDAAMLAAGPAFPHAFPHGHGGMPDGDGEAGAPQAEGAAPALELRGLSQLTWLMLPYNAHMGPLMAQLSQLTALEELYLQVCGAAGTGRAHIMMCAMGSAPGTYAGASFNDWYALTHSEVLAAHGLLRERLPPLPFPSTIHTPAYGASAATSDTARPLRLRRCCTSTRRRCGVCCRPCPPPARGCRCCSWMP